MDSLEEELRRVNKYEFDFENLVFEGGGMKMGAYIGVVKVLEAMGLLQKCKRFAGTSGGAIFAMMLAIRETSEQVKEFVMAVHPDRALADSTFGPLSLLPNVYRKFGWNPANRFLNVLRKHLKERTGNPNITFKEIYDRYGTELCVAATNVSTMSVTYFHPKTTPNMSVALAVRASSSLPGYTQPIYTAVQEGGKRMFYTDGGLLCNFPLHVFDGWYLSLKSDDNFFHKLEHEKSFSQFNPKTLGFVLYTPWEGEFQQGALHSRLQGCYVTRPDTPLARERGKKCDECLQANCKKQETMEAAKRFLSLLREMDVNQDAKIALDEFKNAFEKLELNKRDVELLFGHEFNFSKAFIELDNNCDGMITFDEFLVFMQSKDIEFFSLLEGGQMMDIKSFSEFFGVTLTTVLNLSRKAYAKNDDLYRTAGIYTDYLDTADFDLLMADRRFLINQGMTNTLLYFKDIINKHQNGSLPDSMQNCVSRKRHSTPFTSNGRKPDSNRIYAIDADSTKPDRMDCEDPRKASQVHINMDSVDSRNDPLNHTHRNGTASIMDDDNLNILEYESLKTEDHSRIVRWAIISGMVTFLVIAAVFVYLVIYSRNELLN